MNVSELWLENADFVLKVSQRYMSSLAEAEDIRQEVFLRIINSGVPFMEQSDVKTWLYTITYHCCMDYYREERRQRQILNVYSFTEPLVAKDSQAPVWVVDKISEIVCPVSQLFVELSYGEGWSREEIARIFGYSFEYVCKKIRMGLQQLGRVL
ncbi:MAG: sigma-70 family RNA polymerase sigma factor [Fibromonadales bacterium]|nr:sigma-70 family RNA polymerase sigma factor [Fibromonadales bacterium]